MSSAAEGGTPAAGFGKERRLLSSADYSRVFDAAQARASHKHLLLLARTNDGPGHRLGLVIAKKNIRLAVQRNRIKRIAREVFRTRPVTEPPLDVILLARRGLDQLDNREMADLLREQWKRLLHYASRSSTNGSREP